MADASSATSDIQPRSRGRGKSRGGLGKYLRARGRGRSHGRPAEFTPRLRLEDEVDAVDDPEEAEATRQRYAKRTLVSNADRYAEEEPQLGSDGPSSSFFSGGARLILGRALRRRGHPRARGRSLRVSRAAAARSAGSCAGRGGGRD